MTLSVFPWGQIPLMHFGARSEDLSGGSIASFPNFFGSEHALTGEGLDPLRPKPQPSSVSKMFHPFPAFALPAALRPVLLLLAAFCVLGAPGVTSATDRESGPPVAYGWTDGEAEFRAAEGGEALVWLVPESEDDKSSEDADGDSDENAVVLLRDPAVPHWLPSLASAQSGLDERGGALDHVKRPPRS